MRSIAALALLALLFVTAWPASPASQAPAAAGQAPGAQRRRVLIVTGDDVPAHDWRATTPVTRRILAGDERLDVFVCEDPAILETRALHNYDAVVLNYRNPPERDPGAPARDNLAAFVRSGKGLVVVHFGVFAFSDWSEYRKIVGRVWMGVKDGKKRSGHGPRGRFPAKVVAPAHPIALGIADFEADDELYAALEGDEAIEVLLDAHSDFSGRREPLAWTRAYGEGRVFVTTLGHDVKAREVPEVQRLLLQGTLWSAGVAAEKR